MKSRDDGFGDGLPQGSISVMHYGDRILLQGYSPNSDDNHAAVLSREFTWLDAGISAQELGLAVASLCSRIPVFHGEPEESDTLGVIKAMGFKSLRDQAKGAQSAEVRLDPGLPALATVYRTKKVQGVFIGVGSGKQEIVSPSPEALGNAIRQALDGSI